jgi:hypothetical protein
VGQTLKGLCTDIALFTIGYGDLAPITPAGRTVFVLYALLAVPVVTSFAIETLTSAVSDSMRSSRLELTMVES